MNRVIIPLFLAFTLIGCKNISDKEIRNDDPLSSIINDFENQLEKDLKDDNLNGSISAAIIHKNKIIWSKAFGISDIEEKIVADTNTIFRTASISKPFTAFLMLQLYQKGIIDIDEPIEKYLPEIKKLKGYSDSTKITFRQIASHTSGLQREPDMKDADKGLIEKWEDKVLEAIPTTSFKYKLGEKYSYSNIGYGILGLSLSRAANKSFIELIKDEIFRPLEMNNSFFIVPDSLYPKLAKGIEGGPLGEINFERPKLGHAGRGYKVPNGGIYSTPNDLGKFMMCNMGYFNLLEDESCDLMQTPSDLEKMYWDNGLGFSLYHDSTLNIVEHNGSISGYRANFAFDKDYQYGVIIMRNYNWGITDLELRSYLLLRKLINIEKKN